MDVTVAMPWRATPEREPAHRRIKAFWAHHQIPVIEADSDKRQPFNPAQARNNAVKKVHTELVIVADADSIPDIGNIHQAITLLDDNPNLVIWPYTLYRHIPADWVTRSDLMAAPVDRTYYNSVGGVFILHRETYWLLDGMDEKFGPHWGFEDNAFHHAAATLASVTRIPGIVFSFNHPAERDTTDANPNKARNKLYEFARGKPAIMEQLIAR
jgi:predicted glycosyltransferase involved in capsule biosynthesis